MTKFLRARTWRLVEVAVLLLATAGAFELGLKLKQILVAFILTALGIVIALLIITILERWAKRRAKSKAVTGTLAELDKLTAHLPEAERRELLDQARREITK